MDDKSDVMQKSVALAVLGTNVSILEHLGCDTRMLRMIIEELLPMIINPQGGRTISIQPGGTMRATGVKDSDVVQVK